MAEQPDPAVRKTVSLPESLWKRVEDYQFGNRIKRETEAVRRLIELGLAAAHGGTSGPANAKAPRAQRP